MHYIATRAFSDFLYEKDPERYTVYQFNVIIVYMLAFTVVSL